MNNRLPCSEQECSITPAHCQQFSFPQLPTASVTIAPDCSPDGHNIKEIVIKPGRNETILDQFGHLSTQTKISLIVDVTVDLVKNISQCKSFEQQESKSEVGSEEQGPIVADNSTPTIQDLGHKVPNSKEKPAPIYPQASSLDDRGSTLSNEGSRAPEKLYHVRVWIDRRYDGEEYPQDDSLKELKYDMSPCITAYLGCWQKSKFEIWKHAHIKLSVPQTIITDSVPVTEPCQVRLVPAGGAPGSKYRESWKPFERYPVLDQPNHLTDLNTPRKEEINAFSPVSTGNLPSLRSLALPDSDRSIKNTSLPALYHLSPHEKPTKEDLCRSGKDTSHYNRKTGRNTGTIAAKKREKLKHRTCEYCKKTIPEAEYRMHLQDKHRSFVCAFSFAGCHRSFGFKNEWRRHISTQHMFLTCYKCDLCKNEPATFNRKDLIGQHLKRMHCPFAKKSPVSAAEKAERDKWVRQEIPKAQERCFRKLRDPPTECSCEICGPSVVFQGQGAWEAKLVHMGKHYEDNDRPGPFEDTGFIAWALKHKIVELRKPIGDVLMTNETENQQPSTLPSIARVKYQFTKDSPLFSPGPDL